MSGFVLDPRIEAASLPLGETGLCLARLMDDSRYPWVLLVPKRVGIVELFDLAPDDRRRLIDEASDVAAAMARLVGAEKMNVGSLGNRVRQFHLHVIARQPDDAAWPDAVWNGSPSARYSASETDAAVERFRTCLPGPADAR